MNAFTIERYDHCPVCNEEHSIELYDIKNNATRLTALINMNNLGRLSDRKLSYMICKNCDTKFDLDWEYGEKCPYPLSLNKKQEFLNNYKKIGNNYLK